MVGPQGIFGRSGQRLRAALPSRRELLLGTPIWGLLMAASALIALLLREVGATFQLTKILTLYFAGGVIAWPFSIFIGRFCALGRSVETRFAAYFLCFTVLTIASTTLLFALHYRLFFEQWHAPFGTRIWVYQFVFTSASASYQFVVMGVRLYLPFGLAALVVASLWLAMRPHDMQR
ncbi:hypothetical protein P6U16_00180 [Rhizobium sp. 32-5/1]|uniref:hypothetical protein n=1 Tax=Rhizobium sp. 32-5/1 TaxID=3019602 RepID=UPI00240E9240|nr:hypothetical protein [Rhizobium sp. 32-5/1]WEZ83362.1 hypothetical protein P6U16_00180 [Rhizobium sp. 32-5/1]